MDRGEHRSKYTGDKGNRYAQGTKQNSNLRGVDEVWRNFEQMRRCEREQHAENSNHGGDKNSEPKRRADDSCAIFRPAFRLRLRDESDDRAS